MNFWLNVTNLERRLRSIALTDPTCFRRSSPRCSPSTLCTSGTVLFAPHFKQPETPSDEPQQKSDINDIFLLIISSPFRRFLLHPLSLPSRYVFQVWVRAKSIQKLQVALEKAHLPILFDTARSFEKLLKCYYRCDKVHLNKIMTDSQPYQSVNEKRTT